MNVKGSSNLWGDIKLIMQSFNQGMSKKKDNIPIIVTGTWKFDSNSEWR